MLNAIVASYAEKGSIENSSRLRLCVCSVLPGFRLLPMRRDCMLMVIRVGCSFLKEIYSGTRKNKSRFDCAWGTVRSSVGTMLQYVLSRRLIVVLLKQCCSRHGGTTTVHLSSLCGIFCYLSITAV